MTERRRAEEIVDQQLRILDETLRPLRQSGEEGLGFVALEALRGVEEELCRLRERIEVLSEESLIDDLTGLGNLRALRAKERYFERLMGSEHHRGGDEPPYAIVAASADIKGQKRFNEVHTYDVGNDAIRTVASSLSAPFRQETWHRLGGDEFVGLFPVADKSGIEGVYGRILSDVPSEYGLLRQDPLPLVMPIRCSAVVFLPGGDFNSIEDAVFAADPKHLNDHQKVLFS